MKLLRLILKNLVRSRRRTVLAAAGIGLAVFVVTAVMAVEAGFGSLASSGAATVLDVYEKDVACVHGSRVYDSYLETVRSLPAVVRATGVLKGLYSYQRRENLVAVEGVEYDEFRAIAGIRVVEGSEAEFAARGDGALVGRRLAAHYGWRVGDTVTMVEDGMAFQVAGIFASGDAAYEREVLLHKRFLAQLKRDEGRSTYLVVQVSDPDAVEPIAHTIDAAFANAPRPTKTQSEKAAREAQTRDYRAIRWMLSGMVLATVIASVFGAANSVSMSVRERTREVGILRSLGFRRRSILELLLGESLVLAVVGGSLGVAAAWALLSSERLVGGVVPVVVGSGTAVFGLGMALLIGLLGAVVPAVIASRLAIVDSLRVVD